MEVISRIVGGSLGEGAQSVTGWSALRFAREQSVMSDEDFVLGGGENLISSDDDVEQMLEILIKIARSENRDFLAYLLRMALIEARHHVPSNTYLPH